MNKLIRVGQGNPGFTFSFGDSHHPEYGPWIGVNEYFYVTSDQWQKIQEIQSFDVNKIIENMSYATHEEKIRRCQEECDRVLKLTYGQCVYQMNALCKNQKHYYRIAVVIGEPSVREWSNLNVTKTHLYKLLLPIYRKWYDFVNEIPKT